jgi:tetratricopeptide (TPR) repeat protein
MDSLAKAKNFLFEPVFDEASNVFYRPVLNLSFFIDTLISGGEIGFYHYSNVLLHSFASCALFIFLCVLGIGKKASLPISLLFALHPALTSAVAWVPGRNDILLAIFVFISFTCFIKALETEKKAYYTPLFFCLFAAFLTKETAIILPLMFAAYFFLYRHKIPKKNALAPALVTAAAIMLYMYFRTATLAQSDGNIDFFKTVKNIINASNATLWYGATAFLTEKIILFPQIKITFLHIAKGLCIISFFSILSFIFRKQINFKLTVFGILWFILFLLPTYSMANNIYFTHRMYVPLAGLFISVLAILKPVAQAHAFVKKGLYLLAAGLIILFACISYKQSFFYKDRPSFWLNAVEETPGSRTANIGASKYYADTNEPDKALYHAFAALRISKGEPSDILTQIADSYALKRENDKALFYYNKALESSVLNFKEHTYLSLSKFYEKNNDRQKAVEIIEKGLKLIPKSKILLNRLKILNDEDGDDGYIITMKAG